MDFIKLIIMVTTINLNSTINSNSPNFFLLNKQFSHLLSKHPLQYLYFSIPSQYISITISQLVFELIIKFLISFFLLYRSHQL